MKWTQRPDEMYEDLVKVAYKDDAAMLKESLPA
jgi:hypothetical protein